MLHSALRAHRSNGLELLADDRVRYTMNKPWRDGTLSLVFEPEDLVARLCAMVGCPNRLALRPSSSRSAPGAESQQLTAKLVMEQRSTRTS